MIRIAAAPLMRGTIAVYGRSMRFLAGLSMAAIVVIMLVQVVARYGFNASLIWAEELCRYILVWQTFLLIGVAYQQGELVVLDMLSGHVSPRVRLAIRVAVTVPVCWFLYLLIAHGLVNAGRFKAQTIPAIDFIWTSLTGAAAHLPVFWIYVSVPVGCGVLLVHIVLGLVAEVLDLADPPAGATPAMPPS